MSENDRHDDRDRSGFTRRQFVVTGAAAGALAATGWHPAESATGGRPLLAVAHGPDVIKNTNAAIDGVGGIGTFVGSGDVVNILPNAQGSHPGTSTDPQLVRTVVDLCKQAGASEVRWLTWIYGDYWNRSNIGSLTEGSGAEVVKVDHENESQWKNLQVPQGKALKEVRVFKALWDCDVFISMPIFKDHIGSRFTGVLKNYMGTSHPLDNRAFHPTFEGENLLHMEQCIADLNTVVKKPDLVIADVVIADAMTILTSKGPFGPGDISRPHQVVAGTDRVAIDSYGATLLGFNGPGVTMIKNASELGLGEIDLAKVEVKKFELA